MATPASPSSSAPRLRSLDVFRGMTIALMILVNHAGDWGRTWKPLLHAPWHGWTPTDLVFPFFLFIVGAAIPFALAPKVEGGEPDLHALHRKILRRTLLLFLLGLALIWFPYSTVVWERARIFGVLQRIAIVYFVAALAYLHLKPRGRAVLSVALLAGYWGAMKLVPVPGFPTGDLSPQGNLAFHIDHLILGPHVWRYSPGPGDPEGILSTLPAIVTALIGLAAGEALRRRGTEIETREAPRALAYLPLTGAFFLLAGFALSPLFPINKNLWSPTYVLFTGGAAILVLTVLHYLVDVKGIERWSRPFAIFGRNAIGAYVGSGVVARLLTVVKLDDGRTLHKSLFERLFASWLPDHVASFGWALAFVLAGYAILRELDRRGLRLKI